MVKNLVVHVTLPRGVKTVSGATLAEDTTFDYIGQLDPFYCSIDMVRFEGGLYLRDIADYTIAAGIFQTSERSDQFCSVLPQPGSKEYDRYVRARQAWVQTETAYNLITNIDALRLTGGSHVLGNFSVTRQAMRGHGLIENKIQDLRDTLKLYEPTLKSCGILNPGAKVRPAMAAKGVNDYGERNPARTWIVTGMGANAISSPSSATSGRGKSYQMFVSPPIFSFRPGIFLGTYPLEVSS